MSTLTRQAVIRNEKASEIAFMQEANAAKKQAEFFLNKAAELEGCAQIAHNKWTELESEQ